MNTYQHNNNNDTSYNNGIRPVLPSASSSTTNSNTMFHKNFRNSHNHPSHTTICPVTISTYITLHLDTTHKILNHVLYLTMVCDVMLLLSSFSISYLYLPFFLFYIPSSHLNPFTLSHLISSHLSFLPQIPSYLS